LPLGGKGTKILRVSTDGKLLRNARVQRVAGLVFQANIPTESMELGQRMFIAQEALRKRLVRGPRLWDWWKTLH